jgi:hypothetical protein
VTTSLRSNKLPMCVCTHLRLAHRDGQKANIQSPDPKLWC